MMKKMFCLLLMAAALSGSGAEFKITSTKPLQITFQGKPFLVGEMAEIGKTELTAAETRTETRNGREVFEAVNRGGFIPFRREVSVAPSGSEVELNFAGNAEAYGERPEGNFSYGFYIDRSAVEGMRFKGISGRASRSTVHEGVFGTPAGMKELSKAGNFRWLSFEGNGKSFSLDFNPRGVAANGDYGPNRIQGLWSVKASRERLHFYFSTGIRFYGGSMAGKAVIVPGGFERFSERHILDKYTYFGTATPTLLGYAFGGNQTGDMYRAAGISAYDDARGFGWLGAPALKQVQTAPTGAIYAAAAGSGEGIFKTGLPRPGLYLVTLRFPAGEQPVNASVALNREAGFEVDVPPQNVGTLSIPRWLEDGVAEIRIDGKNWQLSTLDFQMIMASAEDFQFRRSFWLLDDGFEPSVLWRSADYSAPEYRAHFDVMPLAPHACTVPDGYQLELKYDSEPFPDNPAMDWRYTSNIGSLGPSNNGNFDEFNTPEKIERRLRELKEKEGIDVILVNGFLSRHTYPTHVPRVEQRLKEITAAAHRLGQKIIDHRDVPLLWNMGDGLRLMTAKPQYLQRFLNTGLPSWGRCINNPLHKKEFLDQLAESVKNADYDGMMLDEVSFYSPEFCGCPFCRADFTKDTGLTLPMDETHPFFSNPQHELCKIFARWRMKKTSDWRVEARRAVTGSKPNFTYMVYSTHYGMSSTYASNHQGSSLHDNVLGCDFIGTEIMSRNVIASARPVNSFRKIFNSIAMVRPIPVFGLVYPQSCWNIAYFGWALNNLNNQVTWNIIAPPARAGYPAFSAFQDITPRKTSYAPTGNAVYFSTSSRDRAVALNYPREGLGTSEILDDLHIPHEFVPEMGLAPEMLKKYRNLLLLNASAMNDEQIRIVRDFARDGGTVYLTANVASCDILGNYRKAWPFADVFGASPKFPLVGVKFTNIEYGDRKIASTVTGFRMFGKLKPGIKVLMTAELGKNRVPVVLEAPFGKGRLVYSQIAFGNPLAENELTAGKKYEYDPDPELYALYAAFLTEQFRNGEVFENINIPNGMFSGVWANGENLAVHLLNGTGMQIKPGDTIPAVMPDSVFKPLPEPLKFRVKMPSLQHAYAASPDFEGRKPVSFTPVSNGEWEITVPPDMLHRYSVIHLLAKK